MSDTTSILKNLNDQVTITIFVSRPTYNGMTVKDYANGIVAGTHSVLDHDEFETMFGASDPDIDSVVQFVEQAGLTVTYSHCCAASVIAVGTVGQINSAFGITLNDVTTPERTYMTYTGSITLPNNLKDVVEHVDGLDTSLQFIPPSPPPASTPTPGYNTKLVKPQVAATAYNFPGNNDGTDGVGQVIALIEPYNGGYTEQNLTSTFTTYGISGTTVVDYLLDGKTNDPTVLSNQNYEIMLDIAMVAGIVPKATIVVYFCNSIATALNAILNDPQNKGYRPKIVSMSIGGGEGFATKSADDYIDQATTLGVTLIASSGDWGAYNAPVGYVGPPARGIGPCWPASNPKVLAIGGTSLKLNSDGSINSEITWNNNGEDYAITGGNQSTRYPVPTWQTGITLKNYATGISSAPTGRAVPDVAFVGDTNTGFTYNFYYNSTYPNLQSTTGGGTSASAPLWAGLIARINQLTGTSSGFVNSKFYNNAAAFNDILPTAVANNNVWSGNTSVGFSTTTGWDACTGWGSPKGRLVYELIANVGGTKVKTASSTWSSVQNIQVKTATNTWTTVNKVWTKVDATTWKQVY